MIWENDRSPADRVIVALDCPRAAALALADELQGAVRWLKVGMTLFYREGPVIVDELKERGFKIFVDLKLHDIPHQVRGAACSVAACGADMLSVHASGGLAMMTAAYEGVHGFADARYGIGAVEAQDTPRLLGITVLTSMGAETLAEVGVRQTLDDQVRQLALLAQAAGLHGVVCSPAETAMVRGLLGPAAVIVTPGVRLQGSGADDQQRVATPAQALENGADYLVIGRPITEAASPLSAFEGILEAVISR
jgi:orotidine-5'-phosphate decarboxylase